MSPGPAVRRPPELFRYPHAISANVKASERPADSQVFGHYMWSTLVVAACVGIDWILQGAVSESDLVMVFLMGVLVVARLFELGPALWAAGLSVAAFDVLFVEPRFTFAVADTRYLITFAVMGSAGFVLASTTSRIRHQAQLEQKRAQRFSALYELSRALAAASDKEQLTRIFTQHVAEALGVKVRVWLGPAHNPEGRLEIPLAAADRRLGSVVVHEPAARQLVQSQLDVLKTYVQQLTAALERVDASAAQRKAELQAEQERMRSSLLSSVSHDLRTPLGTILGGTTALLDEGVPQSESTRRDMLENIHEEATRLARLLENLLHMTRIEGGALEVDADWHVPEEIVGAALHSLRAHTGGRIVKVEVQAKPALVELDGLLVELALVNVLDNALKHTPPDTPIQVRAGRDDDDYVFAVLDRGPGVSEEEAQRMFDKFQRGGQRQGVGLGLAICRAIATAHGGTITARNRSPGPGLAVALRLPYRAADPDVQASVS